MTFYLGVFFSLWGGVLLEKRANRIIYSLEILAFILFVGVAGLRFETGNDWLVYRDFYNTLPNLLTDSVLDVDWFEFEPFYIALNLLFKPFLNFEYFTCLVVFINACCILYFCKTQGCSFLCFFAYYFALGYLATQMAAIRHSLAISILLVSFVWLLRGSTVRSLCGTLVSCCFHASAALFIPLIIIIKCRPRPNHVVFFVVTGSVIVFFALRAVPEYISEIFPVIGRLAYYVEKSSYDQISLGALEYIIFNIFLLRWSSFNLKLGVNILSYWGTAYLLLFEIGCWFLPVLWTRLMPLVLIFQSGMFFRGYLGSRLNILAVSGVFLFFSVALFRQLSDPALISYIPYQNFIVEELFGFSPGDGEERFLESLELHIDRNVR